MEQNAHEMVLIKEEASKLAHIAAIPFPKDAPVISAKDFKNMSNQN